MRALRRSCVPAIGLGIWLAACGASSGGAGSTTPSDAPCARESDALTSASGALATCRASSPPPWSHAATYDRLVERLDEYERGLGHGDDGDAALAQELAGACWTFFDELASEVVDHAPLDVAEDAAESLLRDRAHDRAVEAVAATRAALGRLHELFAAPTAPDCSEEEADEADARAADEHCRSR